MTPRSVSRAAALLVGDELLSGKVREANLQELAKTLRALGIELCRVVMVRDCVRTIASEMKALSKEHDLVVSSGGVGPTHDDVTLEALALAFDVQLVEDPTTRRLLERMHGENLTEAHLRTARVPQGAALPTIAGVEWPTVVFGNIWVVPGIPEVFRMKLEVLRGWVRGPGVIHSRAVLTRLDEPLLVALLESVASAFPSVGVGSYPKWFDPTYKTKITFDGRDPTAVDRALTRLVESLDPQAIVCID